MRKLLFAAMVLGLTVSHIASAATLVELDWLVAGDGAILRDTNTGIEWLDLFHTRGRSYNDVFANLGAGGDFEGFRFATRNEILGLFIDAGIPDIDVGFAGTPGNVASVSNLIALWNADLWQINDYNGQFGYFRTAEVVPGPGFHDTGLLWVPADGSGRAEATTGDQRAGLHPDADPGATYIGSALVRRAAVPEPASLTLCCVGLAIAAFAFRRKSQR